MDRNSKRRGLWWILAGLGLEVAGAGLILRGLPEFEVASMAGVALVVAGSLLIVWGIVRRSRRSEARPLPDIARGEWVPEAGLRAAPPRPVRLSRTGRRMVVWWSIMLTAVPVCAYFLAQRRAPSRADYSQEFVEGQAIIQDKVIRESVAGEKYYLYYRLNPPHTGQDVRASISVSEEDYRRYNIGDPLRTLYLVPNIAVHEIPELSRKRSGSAVIWFAFGLGAVLLILFEMIRRHHRNITAFGVPVAGKIDMLHRRGAGYVYTVRCEVGGTESVLRGTERAHTLKEGEPVTVLYLPEKPGQKLIYRLSMYEAAAGAS